MLKLRLPAMNLPGPRPARWVLLGALLALGAAVVLLLRPGAFPPPNPPATTVVPAEARLGDAVPAPAPEAATPPGTVALDDFRVAVPPGWQRQKELEDEGPGTKLFLVGPALAQVRLIVGIDVYPLPEGTTLQAFGQQYTKSWQGKPSYSSKDGELCRSPAQIVTFTEAGLRKTFLLSTWRGKGFVIGMISPLGQHHRALQEFRAVLDTFQVYE
jgi:hypothetical protein